MSAKPKVKTKAAQPITAQPAPATAIERAAKPLPRKGFARLPATAIEHVAKPLPREGFARLPAVLDNIPVSKSTWWAGVKSGRFPQPVKLGLRLVAWRVEDIRNLIANAGSAANDATA